MIAISGCNLFFHITNNSVGPLILPKTAGERRVLILYDRAPAGKPPFAYGRMMALLLQNLLGHFPHLRQVVVPIDRYASGSIDDCAATFYLGAYFDNPLPSPFLLDYLKTRRSVVWVGYNAWQLGTDSLATALGLEFHTVAQPDWTCRDGDGIPGFFREFVYLGETFTKHAALVAPNILHAAHDLVIMRPVPGQRHDIISLAKHSTGGDVTPYVVRCKNRWYVADLPFTYLHEADRYLIFADLLFDMLGEAPRREGHKVGLVRFEDVHSAKPNWQLEALLNFARSLDIPFAVSVIPSYRDPYRVLGPRDIDPAYDTLELRTGFARWLQKAQAQRGSIIMHGYTHQCDLLRNPDGASGRDFEFWDGVNNRVLSDDSPAFVLKRLENGAKCMDDVGQRPVAWLTPHYAASAIDNVIFGQAFSWCIGRNTYAPMTITQALRLPETLTFDRSGSAANGQRLRFFRDLRVTHPKGCSPPTTQFFPYEIYGDIYGARMLPENAGYLLPGQFEVDDVLRILSRNARLRDAWGSFYLHPRLVLCRARGGLGRFDGDTLELERLVRKAKVLGYEFVDLAEWTRTNTFPRRADPIEPEPVTGALAGVIGSRSLAIWPWLLHLSLDAVKRHQRRLAGLAGAMLPKKHYVGLRQRYRKLVEQQVICPACDHRFAEFRLNAWGEVSCPVCQSFPRTRAAMLYLRAHLGDGRPRQVLHFAPFPKKAEWLEKTPGVRYVSGDHPLGAKVYRSRMMMGVDLEQLPFSTDIFDLLIAISVVQFVRRDALMFAEVARVLRPGGVFVFETQIFGPTTKECYTAEELASLEYGVKDQLDGLFVSKKWFEHGRLVHDPRKYVRHYGLDIRDRLENVGFSVNPIPFSALCEAAGETPETFGLRETAEKLLFECVKRPFSTQTCASPANDRIGSNPGPLSR
jgi:uncharacterized protein YdaL/SAM-dependent methyltransferase